MNIKSAPSIKIIALLTFLQFAGANLFGEVVTVLPGDNSTSMNARAPQGSRRFINCKYIITAAELTGSGFSGAVMSVGWRWNVPSPPAAGVPSAQSTATTGTLKVYLKDTLAAATSISGTFIDTNGTGYTKVIDGTINIPASLSEFKIDVPVGGPGTSSYTPAPGNAVLVIFVYKTTTVTLPTPLGSPTVFCSSNGAGTRILTYQSQTTGGTTGSVSLFRPETRLGRLDLTINLKVFLEGLYLSNGIMYPSLFASGLSNDITHCDSVIIEFRDTINPFSIAVTRKFLVHTNGTGTVLVPSSMLNRSYYLVYRHRNSLDTWSKDPILFNSSTLSIDFTNN